LGCKLGEGNVFILLMVEKSFLWQLFSQKWLTIIDI